MATKSKKSQDKYKPNQFVVHPHHGAAKVVRKVNKNVEVFVEGEPKSKRIQYFEIQVLMDGLTVMVPVESVDDISFTVIWLSKLNVIVSPVTADVKLVPPKNLTSDVPGVTTKVLEEASEKECVVSVRF